MDVHKAMGLRVQRKVQKLLRATGHSDALPFTQGIAVEVERSERAKARERRKRAAKHAKTEESVLSEYKPTAQIKWFRVDDNYIGNERPLAQIAGFPECGSEWYCLKQLWTSDYKDEEDEWRDIEVVV